MKKRKHTSPKVIKNGVLINEDTHSIDVADSAQKFIKIPIVPESQQKKMLYLTSSSNLLIEDESVLGVTINDSIINKGCAVSGITIDSNILQKDKGIQINVPDSLSAINNSIITKTSLNTLITETPNPLMLTPSDNIHDFSKGVLRLNDPIKNSLSRLEICQPSSLISFEQPNDFLKVTTLDNLNINECGSIRLTTDDNLFIKDGMIELNTELTSKINSQSSLFTISDDNKLHLDLNVEISPILNGTAFTTILDDTKSLLSTFELDKIGSILEINIEENAALQNRFLAFSDSYSNLYKPMEDKGLFITELPETIAIQTPYEYYRNTELISIVSNDPTTIEIEDDSVETEIYDELNGYLSSIDPVLTKMLEGAKDSLKSKNPDRIRHFSISLRELYTHVLHHLSPNEEIRKWSKDPSHYVNKKPTRKARLLYICRGINHDSFTDFVKSDIDSVLSFVNLFQGGTHSIKSKLTDKQLDAMLLRMESTLTYLIKTGKCE